MHCEGPSFTLALPADGGTSIQGPRPSLPAAFAFWREFPEKQLGTRTGECHPSSLGQTCHQDFLSSSGLQSSVLSLARVPQEALAENLEPGQGDLAALDSPHLGGQIRNTNCGWCPGPAQDRSQDKDQGWPRTSSKEDQNSNGARLIPGPGVDLGPRLGH